MAVTAEASYIETQQEEAQREASSRLVVDQSLESCGPPSSDQSSEGQHSICDDDHHNRHQHDDQDDQDDDDDQDDYEESNDYEEDQFRYRPDKCSAVHTLERDMPDFDYSHLVRELRSMILKEYENNVGIYSHEDMLKCKQDDWHLSRYLLRQKLDVKLAFDMLKICMRFSHESLLNSIRPEDFPVEFYQLGGVFGYEPDRKGNKMLYMRVKVHRKTPEILVIVQAFLFYQIKKLDSEAGGKGISIVIDCSGGGLANADMDLLVFLVSTLKNYFPKGLSYFLVHELPWILKPFWHLAKGWLSEEHRQLIKFSDSRTIYEYIERENLPDFMGGTCKRDYRAAPKNCVKIEEAAKLWGIEKSIVRSVINKFKDNLPPETVARVMNNFKDSDDKQQ